MENRLIHLEIHGKGGEKLTKSISSIEVSRSLAKIDNEGTDTLNENLADSNVREIQALAYKSKKLKNHIKAYEAKKEKGLLNPEQKALLEKTKENLLTIEVKEIPLGNTHVHVAIYKRKNNDIVFLNMHDDEATAARAADRFVRKGEGGKSIELKAQGERLVSFKLKGRRYRFDPNRIFTDKGIKNTLTRYGRYSREAHQEVKKFAEKLYGLLNVENNPSVIAMHNNTNGRFSVKTYARGGSAAKEASRVNVNRDKDPDDFFYVNNDQVFELLKQRGYNVVLQNNRTVTDDGSLSVRIGAQAIYINIETQDGHERAHDDMTRIAHEVLSEIQK